MSNKVSEKILTRVYLLFGLLALFAIAILFRVGKIQFFEKDMWTARAEAERIKLKRVAATRGSLLSDDGTVLASSQRFYRLSIDPSLINKDRYENFESSLDTLCAKLALKFGDSTFDGNYFRSKIKTSMEVGDRHLYLLKRPVNFTEYDEAASWPILRASRYHGGLLEEKLSNKRVYPFGSLARITLGILRDDTLPLKGLEYSFDPFLRGEDGVVMVQKVTGETEIPIEGFGENDAIDGSDIVTTINVGMQDIAEKALRSNLEKHKASFGVAILMEVETGHVKAIVNLKQAENGNYYEGYNYAVAELVAPGSTFKLASMMAALEDGAVDVRDSIDTKLGYHQYYDKTMRDEVGLGKITYKHAFERSSNVAISRMIDDHYHSDPGKFVARLNQFGLLNTANLQIKGEPMPVVKKPNQAGWDGTTLPWLSIGYNIRLTPLQVLSFYNAVANDGKLMAPQFVTHVKQNSRVKMQFESTVAKESICSKGTIKTVKSLLEGVVQNGSARTIRNGKVKVAGKTGTAKKVKNGVFVSEYRSSFAGYFPANKPKYSCFVLVDEPKEGQIYGSRVAAPVFLEIAEKVHAMDEDRFRRFKSPPASGSAAAPSNRVVFTRNAKQIYEELDIEVHSTPDEMYAQPEVSRSGVALEPMKLNSSRMPNVKGMSSRDAVCLLENLGMKVKLVGYGRVSKQTPDIGAAIVSRQDVTLELK